MILSGKEIERRLGSDIFIDPFDPTKLNPNSYNLTLSDELVVYNAHHLDMAKDNPWHSVKLTPKGYRLAPDRLYLGRTNERTKTENLVPMVEGRSSIGRLGLYIHVTAGFGDVGFDGFWTLEIHCVQPITIIVSQVSHSLLIFLSELCRFTYKFSANLIIRGEKYMDDVDVFKRVKDLRELYPEISSSFLQWLSENGFFIAPASRKYHGDHEGGLFEHSFAVAVQLQHLTENNSLTWQNDRSSVVVGLFHDICKMDQYKRMPEESHIKWEYQDDMLLKGHGDKSVMILASHIQLTEEEVMCIRYHMGAFTDKSEWNDYTRAVRKYPNVLWTHQADMIASHVMGL